MLPARAASPGFPCRQAAGLLHPPGRAAVVVDDAPTLIEALRVVVNVCCLGISSRSRKPKPTDCAAVLMASRVARRFVWKLLPPAFQVRTPMFRMRWARVRR